MFVLGLESAIPQLLDPYPGFMQAERCILYHNLYSSDWEFNLPGSKPKKDEGKNFQILHGNCLVSPSYDFLGVLLLGQIL